MIAATRSAATIGIDLGGTKLLTGVLDGDGQVVYRRVVPSTGLSETELVETLEREVGLAAVGHRGVAAVGLGVPCTIERESGRCVNAVNLPIRDLPLGELLAERVGLPVTLDNDANVAALAEHRTGAGRGTVNLVLLTIGTGIGGGLILNGEIFRGSSGAGAELGHMVVDLDGPPCQGSCPNRGCIESVASGTALAREAQRIAALRTDSALARAGQDGATIGGVLVTELALAGDPASLEVLDTVARRLGGALSGLANIFAPDLFLLGGGVMAAGELLLEPARAELRARALPPQNETPVRAAELGPDAGMIGAAILAADEVAEGAAR